MNKFFRTTIEQQIIGIGKSEIPHPEKEVLRVLYDAWRGFKGKVTQLQLAERLPHIGSHAKYEDNRETTLRKVRQIVRDLRIKRYAPILSDKGGYWLPQTEDEAREYLTRIEKEIRSRVAASYDTYRAMRDSLGISSTYFEGQSKLLEDAKIKDEVESNTQKGKLWEVYNVPGIGIICTCPGYKYRKSCNHQARASFNNKKPQT